MKDAVTRRPEKSCKEVYREVLSDVIDELRDNHDREEIGTLVENFDSCRSALQRQRARVRPPIPNTLAEIHLDGEWAKTKDGRDLLLFDNGSANRIIGFSTAENMEILCEASAIYMDGTFRVVPSLFLQLYTLHAFYRGQMMPLAYFLLADKSQATYARMFALLCSYATSRGLTPFQPPKFQLDYEIAAIAAIREAFPAALIKGCNFHFTQALWRKVQRVGLASSYKDQAVRR